MKLDTVKTVIKAIAVQVGVSTAMVALDQTVRTYVNEHFKRRFRVREEKK